MVNLRVFRRVCYAAARRTGGKVVEFRISDEVAPNFHQGVVAYGERFLAVVCLRDAALLAIAVPRSLDFTPGRDSGPLTFIDMPDLATTLTDIGTEVGGFKLITAAELDGPINQAQWPGISSYELRLWKPGSLGEALFNYWD